jgi:hypothetical protein
LLAAWALVLWGGLLLALSLGQVPREGMRTVLDRLLPVHGTSAWGWINAFSAGLALVVAVAAAGVGVWGRVASKPGDSGE